MNRRIHFLSSPIQCANSLQPDLMFLFKPRFSFASLNRREHVCWTSE
jgi:hypothetical protein